ncbi:MAG: membrane-bound lytic murein transglycosylase MltF [Proteobacteria bacterium]|nr:membrane-bound lytic murein transglycosylase MltF [Pseudomonadota bacterium]
MPRWSDLGLLIIIALAACSRVEPPPQLGELVVAVRSTPFYYQVENDKVSGFDHDLAVLFADDLGVTLRFLVAHDPAELQAMVREGKAHLATSIAVRAHADGLRYSTPLRQARQLLIEHDDDPPIERKEDLAGLSIDALAGSPQADLLQAMNGDPASFKLMLKTNSNEIDLLEQISQRRSEIAASDEDQFSIGLNFYPDLKIAYVLPSSVSYAWAFPLVEDSALFDKAQEFLERIRQDGTLARIVDRYFGHLERVSDADVSGFLFRMQTMLPRFRADFITAQQATGIDWRLLAALAYQESHWDPLATSPTGVRGMMMLTGETAYRLRVSNRLDARQSIRAGGRYLADLIDQLPPEIKKPDRIWLALAAYNLGMGHMNGARAIARGLKRDPTSWYEMKQVLPLLAREKYYNRLKSGRGRGGEAVIMVENIRTYFDILARFEPPHSDGPVFPEFTPR